MKIFCTCVVIFLCIFCSSSNGQNQKTTKEKEQREDTKYNKESDECAKGLTEIKNCTSCCDSKIIVYDLKCKTFYIVNRNNFVRVSKLNQIKIHFNQELKFKILNVNRYIYDVDFAVDDIEFGSEPSPLFKQLFMGEGEYLTTLLGNLKGELVTASFRDTSDVDKFLYSYADFKKSYDILIDNQLKAYNYCETYECCDQKNNIIFSTFSDKITDLKIAYENARLFVNKKLNELKTKLDKDLKNLDTCKSKLKEKAILEDSLKWFYKNNPRSKRIGKIKSKIEELNCDRNDYNNRITKTEEDITNFNTQKETLEKIWNSIIKPTDEQIMKLVLFNNNLVAENFSYTTSPIYPQGNRIRFGLRISPKDTNSLISKWNIMPLYNDSISFDLPVLYKPCVSFSIGAFIGFGKKLHNELYAWQPQPDNNNIITDSAQYKLVSTGNINNPIGFAALANIGTKLSNFFGLGGSIGVGITVENKPRTAFLGGVSFFIGNKQQFTITYGIVAMQMDRLKSDLYPDMANTLYSKYPGDISYAKKLELGQFISITYTVFTLGNTRSSSSKSKK